MLRFLRVYAAAGALVMLLAAATTIVIYHANEREEMVAHMGRSHQILALSLAHIIADDPPATADQPSDHEALLRSALRDLAVFGAALYHRSGERVLSVGELPAEPLPRGAVVEPSSRLQRLGDGRDALVTVVPVEPVADHHGGLFVLAADVSELTAELRQSTIEVAVSAAFFLLLVYAALGAIMWRATRVTARSFREVMRARHQAEEANRAKSMFLAAMSHEIRTPLNGIMAAAELLSAGELGEDQRRLTEVIRTSSEGLRSTIEDVLDFSRIEAGRLVLEPVQFSLVRLVEDVAELMAMRAAEKGLALAVLVDPATPDHLRGDCLRLRQVLVNLVGNAIKFTAGGHVAIRAMAEATHLDAVHLLVEVEDTGIGVPADRRADIFRPFEQADQSTLRRFGGTGLGLAISHAIIAAMEGQIGVDAAPGGGSRFWFRVRLESLPDRRRQPEADLGGVRVRVVEDCLPRRQAILRTLSCAGAEISDDDADVALVPAGFAGPVAGVRLTLPPPASPIPRAALLRWVAEAAGRSGDAAAVTRRADDPPPAAIGRRLLLAEDHVANQTVLRMMIEQMGHSLVIANDGAEAWALLQQQPFDLLVSDCHMPNMDGLSLARTVRGAEEGTGMHLPIIALTADARSESSAECRTAGFDLWVAKPVTRAQLRRAIDAALARRGGLAAVAPVAPRLDAPVLDPAILLNEVLGGRRELLAPMLRHFLDATRADVEALAAMNVGDGEAARRRAHAIKGAARQAGAQRLAALCQAFENDIRDGGWEKASRWPQRIVAGFAELAVEVDALAEGMVE